MGSAPGAGWTARHRSLVLPTDCFLGWPAAVVYVTGPDLVVDFANEEGQRIAGARELAGQPLRDALPEVAEIAWRAARSGQPCQERAAELLIRGKGREPGQMFADIACQPLREGEGPVTGVLVCVIDVTARVRDRRRPDRSAGERRTRAEIAQQDFERSARRARDRLAFLQRVREHTAQFGRTEQDRRKLEIALRQAERMQIVGQLASGVSHDFGNLLGAIIGYTEMAQDLSDRQDPELSRVLDEIHDAAEKAVHVTGDLLSFGRRAPAEPQVIDLDSLIASIRSLLAISVGPGAILVLRPSPTPLPLVLADRWQVEQVLLNLAINARDAMPHGGRLTISTSTARFDKETARLHPGTRPGRYVELAVRDTGSGMDAEVQEKIFERFFTTKAAGAGTGLGLSSVEGIVAEADGAIEVDSARGRGTTFRIYLPARSEPVPDPATRPQAA
jgi:signal transduction histidine kinase